jgi:predicted phosphoribosyltransferase
MVSGFPPTPERVLLAILPVSSHRRFKNREEAGRLLGEEVARRIGKPTDVTVLGLPRGGVPVAYGVAQALGAPLDVFVVRKLGLPGHEELAMGAIASGGVRVLNEDVLRQVPLRPEVIDGVAEREQRELERRERSYRGERPPLEVRERTVIVVDDGLATGSTMRAAVRALRTMKPRALIVAVPVGARPTCEELRAEADDVLCLATPYPFQAVGLWYEDFEQTADEEVHELLERAGVRRVAIVI